MAMVMGPTPPGTGVMYPAFSLTSSNFTSPQVILTAALAVVILFMDEWGAAQILITVLVAMLAAGQWLLFALLKC